MNTCTTAFRRRRGPATTPQSSKGAVRALQRRNSLVEAHRHLVPPIANHYRQRCPEPQDDLIQVGLLGLIRAAELFCASHQTPFPAFARPHIRGAILHYLRDDAALVRLPRRQSELQTRLHRVEEEMATLSAAGMMEMGEICRRLGMTPEDWQLLQRHRKLCRPVPLDGALLEQIPQSDEEPGGDEQESQERFEGLLATLDPRSQQVLRWVVVQGWSYRRAASALDVSAMTVQRCLHRALASLRQTLSDPEAPHPPRPGGISSGVRNGRAPSAARGWPSRHSPPPAGAPAHHART